MGDDDRRLGPGGLRQGLAHPLFGHRVDGGGGIVEDHHPRPRHHAAGDRHALALAAGERYPPLANAGLIGARQAGHVVVDLGGARCLDDAQLLGPGISVGDVVGHRGVEQKGFLLHQTHVMAQGGESHVPHILAVDGDPPGGDVVEPRDQAGDGRLAGPGGPDDAQGLARSDLEGDVVENLLAGVIAEVHVLEAQHALARREIGGARLVGDLGLQVEDLEQASARGRRPRRRGEDHGDLPDRPLQQGHVEQELGEAAGRHGVLGDPVAAHPQQQAHRDVEADRHHRNGAEAQDDAPIGIGQGGVGGAVELGHFESLGGEGAHHPDALEVLLHGQGEDAHQRLDLKPGDP